MVKVKAFDGFTFKPELYAHILHKNMEYLEECQLLNRFNTLEYLNKGMLQPENNQFIYIYEQQFLGFVTLGILAELSLEQYSQKKIKKHQKTLIRPHLNQNTFAKDHVGPVIVGHEFVQLIDNFIYQSISSSEPFANWETIDGRKHKLWRISNFKQIIAQFQTVSNFYILDGHHRFQAGAKYLESMGQKAKEKHKWIQGLVYSTKYIRVFPQFRKLIHQNYKEIIRNLMRNQKLVFQQIKFYNFEESTDDVVLVYEKKLFKISVLEEDLNENEKGKNLRTGTEKLDDFLKEAFSQISSTNLNPIKFVPSIMFDINKANSQPYPIFLVRCPELHKIFLIADQDQYLPPKSTWLQPKPCLHMVIRVPY